MALDQLVGNSQNYTPGLHGGLGGYLGGGQHPGFGNNPPPLMSIDGPGLIAQPGPGYRGPIIRPPNFIGIQPPPLGIAQPDYSGQFEKFGEQLGGLGEQMTGYQDALGSFNEQIGGMGKQFEAVNNKLDSLEKGIASLQQVQPQQQSYNPYASMMGMFNPYNRFSYGRRFG